MLAEKSVIVPAVLIEPFNHLVMNYPEIQPHKTSIGFKRNQYSNYDLKVRGSLLWAVEKMR